MSKIVKDIVNEVLKRVINEGVKFKQGEVITIPTEPSVARKILRIKYGANPDDFEYTGGGRWIYKLKSKNGVARKKAQPKRKDEYLGRKEDETEQEYLERVRELNKNYAEVEKEIPGEGWRPIVNNGRYFSGEPDYSKAYEVSNMGRVRIIDFEDPMRSRISTGYDAPGRGARNFHLNIPGFKTTPPIHTLVADAWLPEPEGGVENYDVEHIDGNYQNNRADNLRYVPKKGRRGRKAKVNSVVAESLRRFIDKSVKSALNEVSEVASVTTVVIKEIINKILKKRIIYVTDGENDFVAELRNGKVVTVVYNVYGNQDDFDVEVTEIGIYNYEDGEETYLQDNGSVAEALKSVIVLES